MNQQFTFEYLKMIDKITIYLIDLSYFKLLGFYLVYLIFYESINLAH